MLWPFHFVISKKWSKFLAVASSTESPLDSSRGKKNKALGLKASLPQKRLLELAIWRAVQRGFDLAEVKPGFFCSAVP